MGNYYQLIFLCIHFFCFTSLSFHSETNTIQLIHVIIRHGDRTPVDTYPTDPYINESFPPFGWGQLTKAGRINQYELGKFLRKRYGKFLGEMFTSDMIHAQSTDSDRTKMSAQLIMAGLFPPKGNQVWNEKLLWQPVAVNYEPLSNDKLLLVRIPCPRYYELQHEVLQSEKTGNNVSEHIYDYLSHKTGINIETPDDVLSLYSTLKAEDEFGLKLPEWTRKVYPNVMYQIAARSFILNAYHKEMQKLKSGPLFKKILDDYTIKANRLENYKKRKLFLYVGHDSTIVNLLMALGVWESQVPEYNTMIILELHKIKENFAVKILFKNCTREDLYQLKMHRCDIYCPLNKMIDLTKDVVSHNLQRDCASETWKSKVIDEKGP